MRGFVFHIAGERFTLQTGSDCALYAVFADEISADYAHGKGYFFAKPRACFDGYLNAFCLD